MFKKYLVFTSVFVVLGMILFTNPALAKGNDKSHHDYKGEVDITRDSLPDQDGFYKVKDHPDMELRVFVYQTSSSRTRKPALQCNLADTDSASVVSSAGWKLPSTWTYRLNTNSTPSTIGSINLASITSKSFGVWTSAIGNKVTVKKGTNTSVSQAKVDKQNIITWGTAPSTTLAVTYVWETNGIATEVDTIMNKSFSWYWSNSNTCAYLGVYDAQNILTHELGHTMGLNDEYDSSLFLNSTMFGYGSPTETQKNTLTTGDIAGVKALY
jgi:hypothetical protein